MLFVFIVFLKNRKLTKKEKYQNAKIFYSSDLVICILRAQEHNSSRRIAHSWFFVFLVSLWLMINFRVPHDSKPSSPRTTICANAITIITTAKQIFGFILWRVFFWLIWFGSNFRKLQKKIFLYFIVILFYMMNYFIEF